jgi:hypothetical protein
MVTPNLLTLELAKRVIENDPFSFKHSRYPHSTLEASVASAVIALTGLTELGGIVVRVHLTRTADASLAGESVESPLLILCHWSKPFCCTEQFLPKHFGSISFNSNQRVSCIKLVHF